MKHIILILLSLISTLSFGQNHKEKEWCIINCDPRIHKENTQLIYTHILNDTIVDAIDMSDTIIFPLRFAIVKEQKKGITDETEELIQQVTEDLNYAFRNTIIRFELNRVEELESDIKLEQLSENEFQLYDSFSEIHDLDSMITVFILDHRDDFCIETQSGISCSRIGGFSYILSSLSNNLVLSEFDIRDSKVVAHEFGHFFGLYHTFEEYLFGKDAFEENDCLDKGDLICDTPPDPGVVFEIYVNHTTCEMNGYTDDKGNEYSPQLQNIMSYYKPCYLKENVFTKQQELVLSLARTIMIRRLLR